MANTKFLETAARIIAEGEESFETVKFNTSFLKKVSNLSLFTFFNQD